MAYTTIKQPSDYFNTKLYTGTGSSQAITGVDFQPDMVWIKDRTGTGYHRINDAVRGATKEIYPNASNAENIEPQALTSFDTDGFTVGSNNGYSQNGYNFASWNWLANGTGSANTDGSISSTVSASATSGFSIVKYTAGSSGANTDTIGHGLGVIPQMIILKTTTATDSWVVYHHSNGAGKSMVLNSTAAVATNSNIFPTTPTSSVFYPGNTATTNSSSRSYIAYCFAEKQGYSKFGIYNGVGTFPSDVTNFVYTGFKPAFIMLKQTDGESWNIVDNRRAYEYNPTGYFLYASNSSTEGSNTTYSEMDLLSNGFCLRKAHGQYNEAGRQFIYMAFAEQPLVGDNPATAR